MKKCILFLAMLLALCFALTGCDSGSSGGDDPAPVAVTGVSLDKDALVLKTGTDGTLTATVLPENATDKSVTWSSDDETVATVDQNGKVTGVTAGTATITVTTTDGAKTADCEVTVADAVYTVKFDVQGHGTAPEDLTVLPGDKVTKPADPTADGFTFGGWYKETACTTEWKFDTDTVTADNTTLYAKWIENPCKVSFDANGGSGTMDDVTTEKGVAYTVPASEFTAPSFTPKTGAVPATHKNFKGWNTKADGTGDEYVAGGDPIPAEKITGDLTLYAQWANPSFSVSSTEKVYFAKGNMYWDGSKFDMESTQSATTNSWSTSHVSHFYWSKDAEKARATDYGAATSGSDTFFAANGGAISGWDVLSGGSSGKWYYLFNTRTDAAKKVGYGTVCGVNGIILLPDVFDDPMKNNGTEAFEPKAPTGWSANVYTTDNWAAMEAAGAVFLPAAGYRNGSSVSNVGSYGYYWSSAPYDSNYAYYLSFSSSDMYPDYYGMREDGCTVRLVVAEN